MAFNIHRPGVSGLGRGYDRFLERSNTRPSAFGSTMNQGAPSRGGSSVASQYASQPIPDVSELATKYASNTPEISTIPEMQPPPDFSNLSSMVQEGGRGSTGGSQAFAGGGITTSHIGAQRASMGGIRGGGSTTIQAPTVAHTTVPGQDAQEHYEAFKPAMDDVRTASDDLALRLQEVASAGGGSFEDLYARYAPGAVSETAQQSQAAIAQSTKMAFEAEMQQSNITAQESMLQAQLDLAAGTAQAEMNVRLKELMQRHDIQSKELIQRGMIAEAQLSAQVWDRAATLTQEGYFKEADIMLAQQAMSNDMAMFTASQTADRDQFTASLQQRDNEQIRQLGSNERIALIGAQSAADAARISGNFAIQAQNIRSQTQRDITEFSEQQANERSALRWSTYDRYFGGQLELGQQEADQDFELGSQRNIIDAEQSTRGMDYRRTGSARKFSSKPINYMFEGDGGQMQPRSFNPNPSNRTYSRTPGLGSGYGGP